MPNDLGDALKLQLALSHALGPVFKVWETSATLEDATEDTEVLATAE